MASGLLRSALSFVVTDSTFTGVSERSRLALKQTEDLIKKVSEDAYLNDFDKFAADLVTALESMSEVCTASGTLQSVAAQREKLWILFHEKRTTQLVEMWNKFLKTVSQDLDPLVYQTVNQNLYEEILKCKFTVQPTTSIQKAHLSHDEECVVRYASGYIPFILLKRHEKCLSETSVSIVECLISMAVNGEESDFLQYTRSWLDKVNRGGLFEVNDLAYQLFKEIEINLQYKLVNQLQPSSTQQTTKAEMISSVLLNDDIQFYWSMLSTDIEDEQTGQELLREIVELWLTIRGFSVAREWMEMYRRCSAKTTKKSKPLRKSLKKKAEKKKK